ncbi:ABC transporter substrate-binding protein [Aliamphritea spongicola]|uniref:ABC transporter substrate-binding protein n=1 Tax=Aliamphritea spongicola TaxID=707589 RepID=UPI00196B4E57|nr:ABC transporter substrate-binding protein [Aliamphritea spongicola]
MTKNRSLIAIVAVLLGALLLSQLDIRAGLFSNNALTATQIEGDTFPKTLTDAIGARYTLEQPPRRIVSMTIGTDEILARLVPPDRVVGITGLADYPSLSNVTGHYPPATKRLQGNIEEILSLEPDLVFIASYTQAETVRQLLGAGIPVVRLTDFSSFKDLATNIRLVAAATGSSPKAEQQLTELQQLLNRIKNTYRNAPQPRVLYYNLDGTTTGPGTTIDEIIRLADGFNVISETGIQGSQTISEELAISLAPDIILMGTGAPDNQDSTAMQLMQRPAWKNVPAVINRQVYSLKGAWLLSTSQYSWLAIEPVARLLHPEIKK